MDHFQSPPQVPKSARIFNLAVAALLFCMMLAFAAWVAINSFTDGRREILDALAGMVVGTGAAMLLLAVHGEWRTGEPFQRSQRFSLGMALFSIGVAVLIAGWS